MPKYRWLSSLELNELEKEFIEYLVLNGITAEDWTEMKLINPEKAEKIIELFSDVVFETIFRKAKYLDFRGKTELKSIQCLPNEMVLVGVNGEENENIDFSDPVLFDSYKIFPPKLKIYTLKIAYTENRELDLFRLVEEGFSISDGKLFKTLCLGLAQK